jgi:squalene/oxidosqualene cyclase-like protein
MNYVAARLLGVGKDEEWMVRARRKLHELGGAEYIPSWGKFWLSVLNVYDYAGMVPVPPELWYLPTSLPFHPSRMWCHCRVVYLPMAYIYGCKHKAKMTPLLQELRQELYVRPYSSINWPSCQNKCAEVDIYRPPGVVLKVVNGVLNAYEMVHSSWVRKQATDMCLDHIKHEDETTKWIDIGPVNKVGNMLSVFFGEGRDSPHFQKHIDRLYDYLWLSDDGMKMQGYNGSQLWDTAFAVQAIVDSGMASEFENCMRKAYEYLDITQVPEDVDEKDKYFRHISKGAWPFSTRDHGWPISDCTSEGMKAVLKIHNNVPSVKRTINKERLFDAVNVSLSFQNKDGGWATYENTRGPTWLEFLNPSEVFGEIMIDYSYVECTSASVQSLAAFHRDYPEHRTKEVRNAIKRGADFIRSIQRPDGSWYGSWAVCFTYGCWFGVWGLVAAGEDPKNSQAIKRCCDYLVSKQMKDGGWGETWLSCKNCEYHSSPRSEIVNTGWALLALMVGEYENHNVIRRGIELLMRRQMPNGDFPQEHIVGIFNKSCGITYTNYRNIFPIWALGMYHRKYGGGMPTSSKL